MYVPVLSIFRYGLLLCCVQTIDAFVRAGDGAEVPSGTCIECDECGDSIVLADGVWKWIKPAAHAT